MTNEAFQPSNETEHDDPVWLVASPYAEQAHLLNISTLDPQTCLFAVALSHLQVATPDHAVIIYQDVFDFDALMTKLKVLAEHASITWRRQDFYVVEFRSKLKEVYDGERLAFLDKESHKEAVASGGLLKYWFGEPDADRKNLATCFWRDKRDAVKGGQGPQHRQARGIITKTYEEINIKGLRLTIEDDVSSWNIEPYA